MVIYTIPIFERKQRYKSDMDRKNLRAKSKSDRVSKGWEEKPKRDVARQKRAIVHYLSNGGGDERAGEESREEGKDGEEDGEDESEGESCDESSDDDDYVVSGEDSEEDDEDDGEVEYEEDSKEDGDINVGESDDDGDDDYVGSEGASEEDDEDDDSDDTEVDQPIAASNSQPTPVTRPRFRRFDPPNPPSDPAIFVHFIRHATVKSPKYRGHQSR
jgi:hypothetical protein